MVRCPRCQTEFPAIPSTLPGGPTPGRRSSRLFLLPVVVVALAGAGAYLAFGMSRPTEYADPAGLFTARFPDVTQTETLMEADPTVLRWGERVTSARAGGREYAVTALEGINTGNQEVSPASRDAQLLSIVVLASTNANAKTILDRPASHDGHVARDIVMVNADDGRLTALRAVAGEHSAVRMTVTGSGDRDNPMAFLDEAVKFFDTVDLGPAFGPPVIEDPVAIPAAELGAAYRADAAGADAKYKGHWIRVTGPVAAVGPGGTTFDLNAGGTTIEVRRAARGRLSVPVRTAGATVTVTGKVQGLQPADAGPGRLVLTDATVIESSDRSTAPEDGGAPGPGRQPPGRGPAGPP